MIRFAHPEYLHLSWGVPLLAVLAWMEYGWRMRAMARWASRPLWDASMPARSPARVFVKRLMMAGAAGLVALAIAGPQVGTRLVEVKREGTDLVIAIDVSQSMLAEDITPNRILRARHEIARLLDKLRGDRIALVPFAGVAFIQVPLTLDYSAVMTVMNSIEPGMIPQPGTAIGGAIKHARKAFGSESKAQKIILLISDGEDHEPGAIDQAKQAASEGIIIYTVGMANPAGAPIPMKDERGRVYGYKKGSDQTTVVSKLNEKLLSDIANATGGEYYRATPTGAEFAKVHNHISGMDTQEFETRQYTDFEDRFQWLIAASILLLALEEIVPPGKSKKVGK